MRFMVLALALIGLATGTANAKELELPDRNDFSTVQANHVDVDKSTGLSRANCTKFRHYRARRMKDGTAKISYQEFVSANRWKSMKATLKQDGNRWIWMNGDEPRCSIYLF
jgi:hypothetical protein